MGVGQVRVGLDADDFIAEAKKVADALLGQADSTDKLVISMQKYNAFGKLVQATVSGMTKEGERLNVTLREHQGHLIATNKVLDNSASKYKETGEEGGKAGERIILSWQSVIRIFESQVIRQGVRGIIAEFKNAVVAAAELDVKIAQIRAISSDSSNTTQQWTTSLRALANSYGIDQIQAADAAYAALRSQIVNSGNAAGFLESAFKLSTASAIDVKESVKLLSTTMNAFKIDAVNSDRVANVLFQTLSHGAVDATTFADGFGKLSNIAAGSGLRLEEVAAALDTLLQKGVKFNDAAKLIEDVLRSITKPTAEMKALFTELGVSSGEALIKLKGGFGGLLQLLDQETSKGNERLGELAGSFNNLRAVSNLTGDAFDSYNTNLQKVQSNSQALDKATKIVQESIGRQFQAELARTRTYLVDTFGTEVARKILALAKSIGGEEGLVGVLQKLVPLVKAGIIAFGGYKLAVIASTVAQVADTAITSVRAVGYLASAKALYTETAALIARNAALTFGISLAATALTIAALKGDDHENSAGSFGTNEEKGAASVRKYFEEEKKNLKESTSESDRVEAIKTEGIRNAFATRYELLIAYSASVVKSSESLRQRAVDNLKDINEASRLSAATYFSTLEKRISDFRSAASEAKSEIKSSLKLAEDLAKRGTDASFKEKLKYANPGTVDSSGQVSVQDERAILLKGRIRELQKQSADEYQKGTKDSVAEARKMYDEIIGLQQQLFDNQTQLSKKQFEAAVAGGHVAPSGFDSITGKPRYEFTVRTAEVERTITSERQKQAKLEEEYRKQQTEREAKAEAAAEKEKERLTALRALITEAAKFTALDDKGQIKKEFKNDPALAARQYQEIVDKIRDLGGKDVNNEEFRIFVDLQTKRKAIVQEVQTQIASEKAKAAQNDIIREQKASEETIQNARDTVAKVKEEYKKLAEEVGGILQTSNDNIATAARKFAPTNEFSKISNVIYQRALPKNRAEAINEDQAVERSSKALDDYKKALEAATTAGLAFNKSRSPETAKALADALEKAADNAEYYLKKRTGRTDLQFTLPGEEKGTPLNPAPTAQQRIDQQRKVVEELRKGAQQQLEAEATQAKQLDSVDKLDKALGRIPNANSLIATSSDETRKAVSGAYDQMNTKADDYISRLKIIAAQQQAIANSIPEARGNRTAPEPEGPQPLPEFFPKAPGQMYGGTQYYSGGGIVGFEPRGSDQYAAMLSKGEQVINADAAAKFYPLLEAINSGAIRSPTQQSSTITNVGDININYTGEGNVGVDVREIGKQLRRAIKRGNVNLSS